MFKLTPYQVAIQAATVAAFDGTGPKNIIIEANAGCGKTTTEVKVVLPAIPAGKNVACFTFGSRINEEMVEKVAQVRLSANVTVSTFHSAGNKLVRSQWGALKLNNYREQNIAERQGWNRDTHRATIQAIGNTAQKVKEIFPFATRENLEEVAERFDFYTSNVAKEGVEFEQVIDAVERVLRDSKRKDGTMSFADMIWLPLVMGWAKPVFDAILVDECQDLNLSQILLAQKLLKVGGVTIIIGDPRQAIFGFRGADSKSIQRLREELGQTGPVAELSLPQTFRCGKAIVALAQTIVPGFIAHESNGEGLISEEDYTDMLETVKPGDAILSRKNAPLSGTCLKLWRKGVKAHIEGRDFGNALCGLIDTLTRKRVMLLAEFLPILSQYGSEQEERVAHKRNAEQLISDLWDKIECMEVLSEGLADTKELQARIKSLFQDTEKVGRSGRVILSSVHRAKGLEWNKVYGLEWTLMNHSEEEENLKYVMITRAKDHLVWVNKAA